MEFGIALATDATSWRQALRAEELGFSHAWFYDTQMLTADPFVAMAAAAMKTSRIRLGTGVLVPSNRIAPATACAFATLNKLAPGRIDFGVGTGFSARRAMGQGAIKLSEMEEYIRVVMGLLDEETLDTVMEGKLRKIRFLNPDLGLINTRDAVGLHLSAFGPKGMEMTARFGAGWINFVGNDAVGIAWLQSMQAAWEKAGNDKADLSACAFALGCVLQPGESADSPRAMAQAGPRAAVMLHRAADEALSGLPNSSPMPAAVAELVQGYVESARNFEPADAPYLHNHRGHLMFVKPDERQFIDAELIRMNSFTGTEAEITPRIEALRDAGYTQFTIQLIPGQEDAIEDWARIKRALD
jgi:5,10-methylenetetrahydromethanopterin reductase